MMNRQLMSNMNGILLTKAASVGNNVNHFHEVYLIALLLTVVFFVITVVLFWVFDIPKILGVKTGSTQKKSIKNLHELQKNGEKKSQSTTDFLNM